MTQKIKHEFDLSRFVYVNYTGALLCVLIYKCHLSPLKKPMDIQKRGITSRKKGFKLPFNCSLRLGQH